MSFTRARRRRAARIKSTLEYDPDDQFFQAFRAGYLFVNAPYAPSDLFIWSRYIEWLKAVD